MKQAKKWWSELADIEKSGLTYLLGKRADWTKLTDEEIKTIYDKRNGN